VDRVVEDVIERMVVLLFGLDHSGPEAAAEDMVLAAVSFVEGAGVLAVQVTHPVREVRERGLDDEVVVVAEQAVGVKAPAVAAANPPQQLDEDGPIPVIQEDRSLVVPFRPDVVVGAGGEVAVRSSHLVERTGARSRRPPTSVFRHRTVTDALRARHETRLQKARRRGRG
jgi:hypothetical protein